MVNVLLTLWFRSYFSLKFWLKTLVLFWIMFKAVTKKRLLKSQQMLEKPLGKNKKNKQEEFCCYFILWQYPLKILFKIPAHVLNRNSAKPNSIYKHAKAITVIKQERNFSQPTSISLSLSNFLFCLKAFGVRMLKEYCLQTFFSIKFFSPTAKLSM